MIKIDLKRDSVVRLLTTVLRTNADLDEDTQTNIEKIPERQFLTRQLAALLLVNHTYFDIVFKYYIPYLFSP